jgi:hypothetical protein
MRERGRRRATARTLHILPGTLSTYPNGKFSRVASKSTLVRQRNQRRQLGKNNRVSPYRYGFFDNTARKSHQLFD